MRITEDLQENVLEITHTAFLRGKCAWKVAELHLQDWQEQPPDGIVTSEAVPSLGRADWKIRVWLEEKGPFEGSLRYYAETKKKGDDHDTAWLEHVKWRLEKEEEGRLKETEAFEKRYQEFLGMAELAEVKTNEGDRDCGVSVGDKSGDGARLQQNPPE